MSGPFNARRARRRPTINITSLIDVMFLLLIFFMVSSTFRERIGINIELPTAQSAAPQETGTYEISVDSDGAYFFGEKRVDEAGLRAGLQEVVTNDPDAVLVVRADENADWGAGIRAIDIAREVGGKKLVIPTRPMAGKNDQSSR